MPTQSVGHSRTDGVQAYAAVTIGILEIDADDRMLRMVAHALRLRDCGLGQYGNDA